MTYYNYLGVAMPETAPEQGRIAGTSAGNETLQAPAGPSSISGEGGGDLLLGSTGDNTFWITDPGDQVVEPANGGIDTEIGWLPINLAPNIENLTVHGDFNYAYGNSLDNLIVVDGRQWVYGGAGNDVLVGNTAGQQTTFVEKAGEGNDVIYNWNGNSQLQLLGYGYTTPSQIRSGMVQSGNDVILNEPNGESLTIRNTTVASFADKQFLLPLDTSKLGAMTFDDEFNSLQTYNYSTGTGQWLTNFGGNLKDQWAYSLVSNGEQQVYVDPGFQGQGEQALGIDPFSVSNGVLTITAQQLTGDQVYDAYGHNYASGMLNTAGLFEQKYGYFEIRAALPAAAGAWPAFWLLPSPYQPNAEGDVMEALGATPNVDYRRAYGGDGSTQTQYDNSLKIDPTGFHTYGMLWTPTTVTFYFDGVEVLSGPTPSTWTSPMAMIVNMAVGGWGGTPDASAFPAGMQVDYVRAYALADGSSQVVNETPTAPAATLQADGGAAGSQANAPVVFADTGQPVTTGHVEVFASKPTSPLPDHTFAIWEDSGAVFGATSHGGVLDTPTALMAGDVNVFNGVGTWLTDERVAFSYFQPNSAGGQDAWVMVFDTATHTLIKQDLGAATGDVHLVATANGGFAASWQAADGTTMGRGFDSFAYDGKGWFGPSTQLTGDLVGVTAGGELIAANGSGQQLYDMTSAVINQVGSITIAAGSTPNTFTLTRSGEIWEKATVAWNVTGIGDHPANGSDFSGGVLPSGVVTFDINISTVTITLPVTGDTTPDSPDSFQVSLGNVVGAALGSTTTAQGEVTGAGAGAGAGGDTGSGTGSGSGQVLTSSGSSATLTGGAGDDTLYAGQGPDVLTGGAGADSFVFKAAPWNAGHITDFTVGTDKLDLSALFSASGYSGTDPIRDGYVSLSADGSGGTKVYYDSDGFGTGNTIQVLVTDMDHVSPSGLTWAQLSGGASTGGGTGTPPQIAFSTPSVSLAEGDTGTTAFSYTVSRSGDTSAASSVSWAVSGSGTNPANAADFQGGVLPSGTLSFAAGETSKTVVVSVVGDTTVEPDETFTVTLSGATGATLGTATVAGTITNDDGASSGGGSSGQVLTSSTYGATLTGGSGDDTLNAGQGPDVLTGGAGGDSFVFKATPWNAGHVTDFTVGTDKLDLSALFSASGYTGTDPIGDGYVSLSADGSGGTKVYYDTDGPSSGNTIQFLITDLDHVATSGLTWAQLSGGASSGGGTGGGGGATPGQVLTSSTYGATLTGGAGNDTLNAGQGPDVLTGAGGADRFVFQNPPWNAGHITDFTPGTDVLDLRGLFAQSGYTGANPLADNWLQFQSDGQGDTKVYVDMDGPNGSQWPTLVTTLDHVTPSQLGASDWIFH